ncbi:MAG: hypothetical protein A2365_00290 [Candidatus Nealsonbacteria bacterium RIFOXYB1_FULL_40_15]|uniref:Uncharacterized protein n=2 Tax=Candidatus Nealsoniibacteriota TaxID=1817911 RepID=A0A1G2ENK3_9BACT|nr:MAG: hypothetical protein A2365_00290 [Candidatus Nealsonbacteria bacterium RIFOXYB1_FULL_40_15]OGZ27366.1 MAG: hypothetical protein A2427_03450 [Candidatus Nealsonbacteria bacterium RIFOXYC1_FULL_40_7]OGZ28109.1 MAG: hypothetical protein A2562_00465 [Candidatus Nealsonbacteria bacterium RIFOXYD1_FULL_39_11]
MITTTEELELERIIWGKPIPWFAKKALIFMLRKSKFDRPVALKFDKTTQLDKGRIVAFGAHDLRDVNRLLAEKGIHFYFCGYHDSRGLGASLGIRDGEDYKQEEESLPFTLEEIKQIEAR